MGWFSGPKEHKCPRCGAAIPFVISGDDRTDDLMRRSKLDLGQSGTPLCSNCMRSAHQSMHKSPTSRPSPLSQATGTDPQFEKSVETANRIASVFGGKLDQADVEKLKIRLQQRNGDGQAGAQLGNQFGKAMRSCLLTILLMLAFFVVIGWLANEDVSTPPPVPVETSSSSPSSAASQGNRPVPAGSPGAWLSTADYPESAIRAKAEGVTGFRLEVSRAGRVTACTIVKSSGHDELDNAACNAIIRRARFTPARDDNGDATPSSYSNSVRWVLPR